MRDISIKDKLDTIKINPSVSLKNNFIYRGQKINTDEGFNTDIDLRFKIGDINFGLSLESPNKVIDDYITFYATYSFSSFNNFDNTIVYSKRKLTNAGTETDEISLLTTYLREQNGPTYYNKLSYNIDTNDYIDIISVELSNLMGVGGRISYAFNKMKTGAVEDPDYLQFDINYNISNYILDASYVKQLEGSEEDYLTYGAFWY